MKAWPWILGSWMLTQSLGAAEQAQLFLSPRALGRGNTGLAGFDSADSAHINPALLAESQASFSLRPFQMEGFVGQNSIDTVSDILNLSNVGSDALGFLRSFDSKFGQRQYLRGQLSLFPMRIKNFELTPFGSTESWLEMRDPTSPQASFRSENMGGLQAALGFNLPKNIKGGISLRYLARASIGGTLTFTDIFEVIPPSQIAFTDLVPTRTGTGIGGDLGFTWTANAAWRFGLVAANLGDTAFTSTSATEAAPAPLQQNIKVGAHLRKKYGVWDLDSDFEIHDLVNRHATNLLRHLHLGTELGRSLYGKGHDLGLLFGIQEGYFSGGAFVDLWLGRLELSNYAVEIGEGVGQRMDRRWALSLQTSMSF